MKPLIAILALAACTPLPAHAGVNCNGSNEVIVCMDRDTRIYVITSPIGRITGQCFKGARWTGSITEQTVRTAHRNLCGTELELY